ncbi:YceI family protein [Arcobacter lacus]|jgi:polyisoprenoid-binding protein YceI|uniref:Polyisoprenoid-binding protein n=1 Tax=Arcobacter lacus TaxID=1912876 RepID=A0ABX5JJS2_9BACT|nr:YceI family protein [Arcobacter lacus]MCT7909570.1 YceI family protein [Arcobacter lacus]MCT7911573.1 YceI family protein [Arcobacter lacus]PUE67033.1 polyisoprenoid-binding protein [Arcobacter lacus]
MSIVSKITSALLLTGSLLMATEYKVDNAHSNVGFTVKHMMITNVNGNFKTYDANIDYDEATKTFKKLSATVETKTVNTGIEKRDDHLRSDDFFASEKFPKMTFEMTSYKADGDEGKMTGNLTIRGITKQVTLDVEDIASMGNKIGFALEGKINRTDFGLKWNKAIELGGVAVGEEVKIKVDVEAEKK